MTDLSRHEWIQRFVDRIMAVKLPYCNTITDKEDLEWYAKDVAPTYFDEEYGDWESPEEAADCDMSYWEI